MWDYNIRANWWPNITEIFKYVLYYKINTLPYDRKSGKEKILYIMNNFLWKNFLLK